MADYGKQLRVEDALEYLDQVSTSSPACPPRHTAVPAGRQAGLFGSFHQAHTTVSISQVKRVFSNQQDICACRQWGPVKVVRAFN